MGGGVPHHRLRVRTATLLDQPPGQPVHRRQAAVHQRVLAPQLPDAEAQQVPPVVGAAGDLGEVAVQVAGEHPVEEDPAGALVVVRRDRGERHLLGDQPVAQVAHRRALLGDRRAVGSDPPVVDDVGDHVEAAGEVGLGGRRLVLVAHPLRPGQPGLVPERPAEELVPGEHVAEDLGVLQGPCPGPRRRVQAPHPRRLVQPVGLPAHDAAGHEVRPGDAERGGHRRVGAGRHDVVGVAEGQQVAGRVPRPFVAGRAEAVVLGVDDAHAGVAAGVPLGEVAGAVGRAVVDDHDLEGDVLLGEQAVEGSRQVGLDVVDRHDHAEQVGGPRSSTESHARRVAAEVR